MKPEGASPYLDGEEEVVDDPLDEDGVNLGVESLSMLLPTRRGGVATADDRMGIIAFQYSSTRFVAKRTAT